MACAAALAAACASAGGRGDAPGPTLEIRNGGPAAVDLHLLHGVSTAGDTIGYSLGTVFSGRTVCLQLEPVTSPQWLTIHSIEGTLRLPSFLPTSRQAWSLELTGNPHTDVLALAPAAERCTPGTNVRTP